MISPCRTLAGRRCHYRLLSLLFWYEPMNAKSPQQIHQLSPFSLSAQTESSWHARKTPSSWTHCVRSCLEVNSWQGVSWLQVYRLFHVIVLSQKHRNDKWRIERVKFDWCPPVLGHPYRPTEHPSHPCRIDYSPHLVKEEEDVKTW